MREQPRRRQLTPQLEALENRLTPTAPVVLSIDRAVPAVANTNAATVSYAVTFDQPVIGVDAADFRIAAGNSVAASAPVVVAGSGSAYTITINRIHGSGALRLDLIDNDSIENGDAETLGGPGAGNGSFQGRAYEILQAAPTVVSIGR